MKFSLTAASVLVFISNAVAQSGLTINTPASAVVCQPLLLAWSGGTPPYFLVKFSISLPLHLELIAFSILPGNQPSAPALKDFGQVTGTSLTWVVNFEANTSLGLTLRDSSGTTAQSAAFTVQAGTDTSCVGKDPSSTAGGSSTPAGTSTGSAPATTPATTPLATATSLTTPITTIRSSSSGTATSSGAATSTSNAAVSNAVEFGAAGVVGAIIALLA